MSRQSWGGKQGGAGWRPRLGMNPFVALSAARGTLFPWVPVFMAMGIGLWFSLPWEPGFGTYGVAVGVVCCLYAGMAFWPPTRCNLWRWRLACVAFGFSGGRRAGASDLGPDPAVSLLWPDRRADCRNRPLANRPAAPDIGSGGAGAHQPRSNAAIGAGVAARRSGAIRARTGAGGNPDGASGGPRRAARTGWL